MKTGKSRAHGTVCKSFLWNSGVCVGAQVNWPILSIVKKISINAWKRPWDQEMAKLLNQSLSWGVHEKQGFLQALWRRWCCSDRVMVLISFWPLACDYHFTSRHPSAASKQCSLQWHYCYCCGKMKVNKGTGHVHRATGFYKHFKIHNF